MRMRTLLAIALWLGAGTAFAAGLEGRPAPAIALTASDGGKTTVADAADRRVAVVLFWASWCPYCEALMPHLERLRSEHPDDLAVLAINVWDEKDVDPAAVLAERGLDFVSLRAGGKQPARWGVKGTPGLFVLDRDGTVLYDRTAHTYDPPSGTGGRVPDRRTAIARSAQAWADAVRDAVERALAPP